jgi:plastocyanin
MKRLFSVILVLLVVVLSGCTGRDVSSETEGHTFDRANPNLNGKIMDLEFLPTDVRAGEKITANLVVGNTGSENIVKENIEIEVKPISLNDFLANIALLGMSDSKKTLTFSNEYNEEIKPGMIKPLSYVFPTPKELKGKNLDGTYSITIILSVNGQNVESRTTQMKLRSGKSRESSNTPVNTPSGTVSATSTPVVTVTASPATTVSATQVPTPTPTSTPLEVTVEPTGKIYVTRIMGYKFAESTITLDAGNTLQWYNLDDDTMIVAEMDGKIPNQSVYSRRNYNFTTTGIYRFQLFFPKMRVSPPTQTITVKLNQSK